MSDLILLSHQEDESRVEPIIEALVEDRQSVKWLRVNNVEAAANKQIGSDIEASHCVVLIWSEASAADTASPFHALAKKSITQGKAICVLIDTVTIPPELGACTVYDMRGWRSEPQRWRKWLGGNLYMRDLVTGAKYKVAGSDPPPPGAPRQMLIRHALVLIPAIFAPLAVIATLVGLWGDLGFSDGPSADETKVWETVAKNDCSQLRQFLAGNPANYFAEEAQVRLDGAERRMETRWERADRPQPLYIGELGAQAMSSRTAALKDVQTRAAAAAQKSCDGLARAGNAKLIGAQINEDSESCSRSGPGFVCSLEGEATCQLSEPREIEVEICSAK